jgi:hypothetical protein
LTPQPLFAKVLLHAKTLFNYTSSPTGKPRTPWLFLWFENQKAWTTALVRAFWRLSLSRVDEAE